MQTDNFIVADYVPYFWMKIILHICFIAEYVLWALLRKIFRIFILLRTIVYNIII